MTLAIKYCEARMHSSLVGEQWCNDSCMLGEHINILNDICSSFNEEHASLT